MHPVTRTLLQPYPRPKQMGGVLIRRVVRELTGSGYRLPIASHILIAVSGGPDSTALAHMLTRYGRRIAPKGQIQLLHCNHGWRGKESDADQAHVESLGREWGVPVISGNVEADRTARDAPHPSPEDSARRGRKTFFIKAAERVRRATGQKPLILTAHHADDQAETVLWRVLTGQADVLGAGILRTHDRGAFFEVRPLLTTRKSELLDYLKEEGVTSRFDSSNTWAGLLRNRMRQKLMPEIEAIFPRAVEHLTRRALEAQAGAILPTPPINAGAALAKNAGIILRAAHYAAIKRAEKSSSIRGSIDLPGEWHLHWHGHGPRRTWRLLGAEARAQAGAKKQTSARKSQRIG